MSAIWGIFYRDKERASDPSVRTVFSDWHGIYGSNGTDTKLYDAGFFGCSTEHFSDSFPSSVLTDKSGWAVMDALIYNRKELLDSLSSDCSAIDSQISDEELLLVLIRKRGFKALADVNGDFAGAVYNSAEESWTIFRDHLGVRPLYVYEDDGLFAFATDLRALLALPGTDSSPNEGMIRVWLSGGNALSPTATFYRNIRAVLPGSYEKTRWNTDGLLQKEADTYWILRKQQLPSCSDREYCEGLKKRIMEAISRRLAVFPGIVGVEMSGGLDSGVIGILINRLGRQAEWISWSMPEEDCPLQKRDERIVIQDICRQEHKNCHYLKQTAQGAEAMLKKLYPPFVNTLSISQTAEYCSRCGIRVVFSGQGGDEGVSHRANILELWYQGERSAFFSELWNSTENRSFRVLRFLKNLAVYFLLVYPRYFFPGHFSTFDLSEFLLHASERDNSKTFGIPTFRFGIDPIQHINSGGERSRLDNTAFQGAEQGVRYVFPYLDKDVLEYAVSLPRRLFLHHGTNRYIYREAFRNLMPESLYQVDYKDMPSLNGLPEKKTGTDLGKHSLTELRELLERSGLEKLIDFSRAYDYLDSHTGKKAAPGNKSEAMKTAVLSGALLTCALMQNLIEHAKDGPRPVDK